jgi:hypothetical protein
MITTCYFLAYLNAVQCYQTPQIYAPAPLARVQTYNPALEQLQQWSHPTWQHLPSLPGLWSTPQQNDSGDE